MANVNRPGVVCYLVCLLLGALLTLSFAPFELWWLGLFSLAGLRLLTSGQSLTGCLTRYYCFALGLFSTGISWIFVSIYEFGGTSEPLAALIVALFVLAWSLTFLPQAWLLHHLENASWSRAGCWFAVTWVLGEALRATVLTGFPWLLVGTAHVSTIFAGWAPLGSVFLVSGVIALFAELLILGLCRPRPGINIVPLAGSLGLLIVTLWVSVIEWTEPKGVLTVAAVQGNLDQRTKWQTHQFAANFDRHWQPTLGLSEADLVVWPEASFTEFRENRPDLLSAMDALVGERGQGLIIGLPDRDENGYTNTALGLGEVDGSYAKRHLVPFGEYVPLEQWLRGVIAFFDLPMSRNRPGSQQQAPLSFKGQPLSLSICYEIAYPHLVRSAATQPMVLVTISNDTWFGDSIGPVQHLQIAQMRALENGRSLLRVTNNGITAAIDHAGEITDVLPRNQQGVLQTELVLVRGDTPYHRFGYGILGAILIFVFLLNIAASRWRSQ